MGSFASSGCVSIRMEAEELASNLEPLLKGASEDSVRALELFSTILASRGISLDDICRSLDHYVSVCSPGGGCLAYSAREYKHLVFGAFTFLTSAICEDAGNMGASELETLGLEVGDLEGDFYPLTADEQRFIGDSSLELFGHPVLTGYSVVIGNRKFAAPAIEIDYGPEKELYDFSQAARVNADVAHKVAAMAQSMGGLFYASASPALEFDNGDGKFVIHLFVPMENAKRLASDFSGWLAVLRFAAQGDRDLSAYLAPEE